MIEEIISLNPGYGLPRIKVALRREYGEVVNHKLLRKLLGMWGLSLRRAKQKKKSWIKKVLYFLQRRSNLLRKAAIDGCFKAIVSDITQIPYQAGIAYFCVHLDYFGKMVYGWELSLSPDRVLVRSSFRKAKRKLKRMGLKSIEGIIFHQDKGTIYTSASYTTEVLNSGGYLSYSAKGEPGDNAVNEAFFSRLKEEWRDLFAEADTFEELKKLIKKAIAYYNEKRYHTSLNNMTPAEFTKNQLKRNLTLKSINLVW